VWVGNTIDHHHDQSIIVPKYSSIFIKYVHLNDDYY